MAIQKKLIHFKSLSKFQEALRGDQILDTSIVFIQDAKLIWTHGTYYSSVIKGYDKIVITEDNVNILDGDSYSVALKKLEKSIESEQQVIAASLTDLEDRIKDFQFVITEDYVEVSYPTDDPNSGIDEKYVFTKVQAGDQLNTAFNKVETNISILFEALLEDEEIISQTMTSVDSNMKDLRTEILDTLDKSFTIDDTYTPVSYPNDLGDVSFDSVQPKDSLSDAIKKLETNISTLIDEVIKDEETMVAALCEVKQSLDNKVFNAKDISGSKNVELLEDLYSLEASFLSPSGINYNNDAIGQVWYVIEKNADYRLISWANRESNLGWEKLIYNNSSAASSIAVINDLSIPDESIACYDPETAVYSETNSVTTSEPTLEDIQKMALQDLYVFDSSDRVNGFYLNNELVWLDKLTRMSLMYSVKIEKEAGKLMSTLWINDRPYTVSCEVAIALLSELELYAIECFNKTSEHKLMIKSLTTIDEVLDYDFMSGYPDRLSFTI